MTNESPFSAGLDRIFPVTRWRRIKSFHPVGKYFDKNVLKRNFSFYKWQSRRHIVKGGWAMCQKKLSNNEFFVTEAAF